jgi:hypothetical protein
MILAYIVGFLIFWAVSGFLFTMLLWPIIAKRIERDYPSVKSNGTDNL